MELLKRLQFLTRLEPNCLSWRDSNLCARAGIASYACFARADVEDTKSAQLNPFAVSESTLHAFKDRFYGHFCFGFGDASPVNNFVDDVELYQDFLPGV